MTTPTEEGLRRYPDTQGYNRDYDPPIPCTCNESCPPRCTGRSCGCEACAIAFAELLDDGGEINADALGDGPAVSSDHGALADLYEGRKGTK